MNKSQSFSFQLTGALIGLLLLPLIFIFQNCSGLDNAGVAESEVASEEIEHPEIFGAANPFPFKVNVNHLAYMSCNNLNSNSDAYFTFRMNTYAYNQLDHIGLGVSDEFLDYTKNYESKSYQISKIRNSLPIEGIKLQMSLNNAENYIPTTLVNSAAKSDFFPPLESDAVMSQIFNNTNQSVYLLDSVKSLSQRHIASSLFLNDISNETSNNLRAALSTNGSGQSERNILAVSYTISDGGDGFLLGSHGMVEPNNTKSKPFGKGFQFEFDSNTTTIRDIKEFDLNDSTQRKIGSWSCNGGSAAKLRVVAYANAGPDTSRGQFCSRSNSGLDLNLSNHRAIANMLKLEHWYINIAEGCITPKRPPTTGFTCYGRVNEDTIVDYTGALKANGTQCDTAQGVFNDGQSVKRVLCPRYVTVCSKQSD